MTKKELPVIDIEFGKKLSGGKEGLAREMIDMLKAQLPKDFALIQAAFEKQDLDALQVSVHKLHGAVSYCGTPALKQATADLELALHNNQHDKVTPLFENLSLQVTKVSEANNA